MLGYSVRMVNRAILLAMLFASAAMGQQQDRTMIDRIMNLDRSRPNPMGGKEFESAAFAAREFRGADGYAGVKPARTKEFGTRSFLGIRNPWFGKKVYETKAARELTRYVLSDKAFASREVEAGEAPGATRRNVDDGRGAATRRFLGRGKSQKILDQNYPSGGALSIDEVRDILNRNR